MQDLNGTRKFLSQNYATRVLFIDYFFVHTLQLFLPASMKSTALFQQGKGLHGHQNRHWYSERFFNVEHRIFRFVILPQPLFPPT